MSLQSMIDNALAKTSSGRGVWVGLSGGLDSSLLLTLAATACHRHPRPLRAVHVHHGLQVAADGFERHCRRLCSQLGVPLTVERVHVDPQAGKGLEGAARDARYAAFARCVPTGDTLWLAQHRDDQAETWWLAALRGSGVRGLGGMPGERLWHGRTLVRPLLEASRAELEAEAARLSLDWVEDPSNRDERLDRNFLRGSVLPLLETRWPRASAALARSAELAGEADGLLAELAELDLQRLGEEPSRLPIDGLATLSVARQRLLIRHACTRLTLPTPPARPLNALLEQLTARADAGVKVAWPGGEARRWHGSLYLMPPTETPPAGWQIRWDGRSMLETPLGSIGVRLTPECADGAGDHACVRGGCRTGFRVALRVAFRQGGERLRLAGRGGRDLKRLMQEAGVPPWRRAWLLVVWQADEVVAVLDPQAGQWLLCAEGWRASGTDDDAPAPPTE
ncbi:tRNA lysidine(34) synthetase TilS [Halomonas urumqiensis]|uniref:tRNA(Ile)-lysidine synthase n=1 Tax=Halomonas urumqiensis TaxID=1684789 RepID=A0A2N7UIU9_9GAMM|nr:tRNA lysidine(34) synthetase TilS [Halomonas urumqiensis]PMR80315.1 tRNA lysidine(34) synthetase TilS [Halomonas urumqiensis]PTB01581.1 tRNA lysidine(34) synthetase TilS [Halomonas urumqiensis]GHE22330.1 tRNA(Ile)-lysidine synthase [Halomonas urumqiensis]